MTEQEHPVKCPKMIFLVPFRNIFVKMSNRDIFHASRIIVCLRQFFKYRQNDIFRLTRAKYHCARHSKR
jgi:hypothetical protein